MRLMLKRLKSFTESLSTMVQANQFYQVERGVKDMATVLRLSHDAQVFLAGKGYNVNRDEKGIYISNYVFDDYYREAKTTEKALVMGFEDYLAFQLGIHWKAAKSEIAALMTIMGLDEFEKQDITTALVYLEELETYIRDYQEAKP